MKKITGILLAGILFPLLGSAQSWHAGGFLGISNYSGDLVQQRVDLKYTKPSVGLFVRRDINRFLTLRLGVQYGNIAGADSTNESKDLRARNLSFRSDIWEVNLMAEINFLDIEVTGYTPYVFVGVAGFSFYPTTKDSAGGTVRLRRLRTEGQGLPQYPDRQMYNIRQVSIPFGVGVKVQLNDLWTIGAELGFRKTFTDYLDDVSTTYVDQNTLLQYTGPNGVKFAYRGDEVNAKDVPRGTYPVDGTIRGSDKNKDWYVFSGVTLAYRFGGSGGSRWGRQKVSTCPRF